LLLKTVLKDFLLVVEWHA